MSRDLEIDGLEELERDLFNAITQCPEQAKITLKDIAKDFKKAAKRKANTELNKHDREGGEKKKAIKAKWGSKVIDENIGMTALIWNSARHFHLIENGHNLVKNGRVIGFVEGKHIMEKTQNDYKDIVTERFEQMIEDILRGCNLN